jgi:hypothetical protein
MVQGRPRCQRTERRPVGMAAVAHPIDKAVWCDHVANAADCEAAAGVPGHVSRMAGLVVVEAQPRHRRGSSITAAA